MGKIILFALAVSFAEAAPAVGVPPLSFDATSLKINGERKFLVSGEFHYFRVPPSAWRERLRLLKEAGGNCVATYVPWILHEPVEGKFLFGDCPQRDLDGFLRTVKEEGLLAIVRPGPYQYSELVYDGLPRWLIEGHPEIAKLRPDGKPLRAGSVDYNHPVFLAKTKDYFREVAKVLKPHLAENGGPIAMVQLDNELCGIHTWFGYPTSEKYLNDCADYLVELRDYLKEFGIGGPYCHNSGGGTMCTFYAPLVKKLGTEDFLLGYDHYYNLGNTFTRNNPDADYLFSSLFACDVMRSYGYPPVGFEIQCGTIGEYPPILKEDLLCCHMCNLAAGMKGVNYYVFTGGPNFPGTGNTVDDYDYSAPIASDGTKRPTYDGVKEFGAFVNGHPELLEATRLTSVRLGFEWSNFANFRPFDRAFLMNGVFNALMHTDVLPEFFPLERDLDTSKPLVLAGLGTLTESAAKKVVDFVHAGGKLLILPDVGGLGALGLPEKKAGEPAPENVCIAGDLRIYGLDVKAELLPSGDCRRELVSEDGSRVFGVSWKCGKGEVAQLGVTFGAKFFKQSDLLANLLVRFGAKPVAARSNRNVYLVTHALADGGTGVFALNLQSSPQTTSVALPSGRRFDFALGPMEVKYAREIVRHVSGLGFDPSNSTAFVQAAIDSEADTIVLDAMPSPWYLDTVKLRSGKRILIGRGAKVLRDWRSPLLKKGPMFLLKGVKDVRFEGAGVKETYVGGYASHEERVKHCRWYGKSVFELDCATNVLIRGMTVAESEEDGVLFGGCGRDCSLDTRLEDLDLVGHYRQACSICDAKGVRVRNVTFRDTLGNEPGAGIDVEPVYPCATVSDIDLENCRFFNNHGGAIIFSMCSENPIRFRMKGCTIGPHINTPLAFPVRNEGYLPRHRKADVEVVIEDTTVQAMDNVAPVQFSGAPLFNVVFRNVKLTDGGGWSPWRAPVRNPPIEFKLDRDPAIDGGFDASLAGSMVFEKVVADGFGGPFVGFRDTLGRQDVPAMFRGTAVYNGKTVDCAAFSYAAPDRDLAPLARVPVARLQHRTVGAPPTGVSDLNRCRVVSSSAWFQKLPEYSYYFFAKKGDRVGFTVTYPRKITYADMAVELKGKRLLLDTPAGEVDLGEMHTGSNRVDYVAAADGWHAFRPPKQGGEGNDCRVTDVTGARFAYQADTLGDSLMKIWPRDLKRPYRGYFEVPPGADCRIVVLDGEIELLDAEGKVVEVASEESYYGRHVFTFRAKGTAPEVWSFRSRPSRLADGGRIVLKFYAPLNGIWADLPEELPRTVR